MFTYFFTYVMLQFYIVFWRVFQAKINKIFWKQGTQSCQNIQILFWFSCHRHSKCFASETITKKNLRKLNISTKVYANSWSHTQAEIGNVAQLSFSIDITLRKDK